MTGEAEKALRGEWADPAGVVSDIDKWVLSATDHKCQNCKKEDTLRVFGPHHKGYNWWMVVCRSCGNPFLVDVSRLKPLA